MKNLSKLITGYLDFKHKHPIADTLIKGTIWATLWAGIEETKAKIRNHSMNQSTSDIQPALADQSTPMASKRPLQSDINAVKRELAQALHGEAKIHTIPQKGDQNRRYIITMKDGCNAYNHIPEVEKVCLRNGLLINETSIDHIELATEFHTR